MEREIGTPRGRKGMVSENGTQQGEATKRNYKGDAADTREMAQDMRETGR